MKTRIEEYNLRSESESPISFTLAIPATPEDCKEWLGGLSEDESSHVVRHAIAAWAYRGAAKKENNGKAFELSDLLLELAKTRGAGGGPSKADIESAEKWVAENGKAAAAAFPYAKDADDATKKDAIAKRAIFMRDRFETGRVKNQDAEGISIAPQGEDESLTDARARLICQVRKHRAAKAKQIA